jgi:hypothetical protein
MRFWSYFLTCVFAFFISENVQSQPLPTGWSQRETVNETTEYVYQDGNAFINVSVVQNTSIQQVDAGVGFAKDALENSGACPGIKLAVTEKIISNLGRSASVQVNGRHCFVLALWSDKTSRLIIGMETTRSDANTKGFALKLLQHNMVLPNAGTIAPTQSGNSKDVASADRALAAAVAAIPISRRPIGIIQRNSSRMVGNQLLSIKLGWMMFANGYASNCWDWDPRKTDPTPSGLAPYLKDCSIARWTRKGASIFVTDIDADNANSEADEYESSEIAEIKPFTKGQRVSLSLESGSALSFSTYTDVTSNIINLNKDGEANFSKDRKNWTYGDNINSSSNDYARYYLDGYILAIQSPDGSIKIMYLGLLPQAGKIYGYLNGELHWPPD